MTKEREYHIFIKLKRGFWSENKTSACLFVLISVCYTLSNGFIVEPLGLSGTYIPFGNYAKAGKAGPGVSWSKNLDAELQLRYAPRKLT